MRFDIFPWLYGLWIAFGLIWLLGAMKTKPAALRLSGISRFVQLGLAAAGAILLLVPGVNVGWLGLRFLPEDDVSLAFLGLAMTAGGIAFAVWARFVLGQNWSSRITLKQGHELICRGPYVLVRHPIYSGVLLALFGTAICIGEFRGLIAFGLFLARWLLKVRIEEALMIAQFGEQYRQYQRKVKALIPFVL